MMMPFGDQEEEGEMTKLTPPTKSLSAAVSSSVADARPRLHNFSFPSLSWGSRRLLRCVYHPLPPPETAPHQPSSAARKDENPLNDRRTNDANDNDDEKKKSKPKPAGNDEITAGGVGDSPARTAVAMPWNLRTRRAACRSPVDKRPRSPMRMTATAEGGMRRKFSVEISKEEIEEDFLMLKGTRPPRRPKKRHRNIQKQLDTLFPGLWLSEITPDYYS